MPGSPSPVSASLRAALCALLGMACAVGARAADDLPQLVVPGMANPAGEAADADQRVLPVWNNESGRVEALLLLDTPQNALTPLDRLLRADAAPAPGFGARVSLDGGSTAQAALQIDPDAGMALLCNGSVGLSAALGRLGEDCLLASLGEGDILLRGTSPGLRFGGGWQSGSGRVDLSFGLSWLDTSLAEPLPDDIGGGLWTGNTFLGASPLSGLAGAQLEAQQLQLGASMQFNPRLSMSLGGSLATQQFTSANGGLPLRWDAATVSFGVGYRGITGQLTGRLLELPDQNASWSGLDLGFSWRTPWRAELSVGARNVIGSGTTDPAKWPLAELPAMEDPTARVPYVRYRQDL